MAELEIHHEGGHGADPMGQKVGVQAAILAVALAIVSIASHRTHTEAILQKSTANDEWAHYQSTRVKFHNLELGEQLATLLGPLNPAAAEARADFETQRKDYDGRGKAIQARAEEADRAAEAAERRGLLYDVGEGFLEIALVVTSLYFIARKGLFPVIGVVAGIGGVAVFIAGLLK
jgi:hypothetical protein